MNNQCFAIVVVSLFLPSLSQAYPLTGDPKGPCDCFCGLNCNFPFLPTTSDTSSSISLSEGNLKETVLLSATRSSTGPTMSLSAIYNSYNADGSRAAVDTVMGYGWTHSYNNFLFTQLGAMFRFDGSGRVTRFKLGPGGTYIAPNGYFETLVKNPGNTFTITQKDKTVYNYAMIPGTPFTVAGPVWQLTSIVDRHGNKTMMSYTGGLLTSTMDTYGRITTYSYNAQNKLASSMDPGGRATSFQYDTTGHLLTQILGPNGKSIQYSYNSMFQLISKADKDGRSFTYSYSGNEPMAVNDGNSTARATLMNPGNWATDPTQRSLFQSRVYVPAATTNIDGRGNAWQYQYDANGYITKMIAPDSTTTTYTYDPATLQVATITDANAHTNTNQYDSMGNRIQTTDALGHTTTYTYEPVYNMMTSMTDPRGRLTTYTIDPANGDRLQETDPLGQTRKWTYDSHGNVLTSTDKNGNVTQYQYDAFGNMIQETDAVGTSVQSITHDGYDAVGNRTSMIDALGRTNQYQYDGMNRMVSETDAVGTPQQRTIQTFYDGEGNRIKVIDGRGINTTYQYDQRQRLVTEMDAVGTPQQRTTQTLYDGNDNRTSVTDPLGRVTTYQFDTQNRLIRQTDATGTPVQATTQTAYDGVGNITGVTDANGHTASYTFDALNRRSAMTDALGDVTRYSYDNGTFTGPVTLGGVTINCTQCGVTPGSKLITGQVDPNGTASQHAGVNYFKYDALDRLVIAESKTACIGGPSGSGCPDTITFNDALFLTGYDAVGNRLLATEPNGNTTGYHYDAKNRLIQQTNAASDVTATSYDLVNNVLTMSTPNLNVTTNAYDALNRVIQVTDTIGLVATSTYDADDNRVSHGDGNGNITSYNYDSLNRLASSTDPLGKTSSNVYDPVGNLLSSTDRNGNPTSFTYDALNRRSTTTDALGNTSQWQYDLVGNTIRLTDANSHITQYGYDAINRRASETYADSKTRSFTYDGVGNMITRTDQIGQVTTYSYNDLYFQTGRSYPSAINDTFTYDLAGRALTAQRGTWAVTFSYDGANRITQTVQNGHVINYSYNIPGRTRTLTYPGGRVITEHTDARTRMDHIDDGGSPSIVQYSYDLASNARGRNYRNGTTSSYGYNANNWTMGIMHANPAVVASFGYAYDNEGNKQFEQKVHDPTHSECYGYDTNYRLISYKVGTLSGSCVPAPATQTAYSLDPVGNWNSKTTNAITQTRTHNSTNELVQIDLTGITYDFDGNTQSDGTYTYAYDEENRITSVTRNSDSAVVGQYQYDALSRRVQKIANPNGTPNTTVYLYDGIRIIEEQNGAGATQATYVYGNGIDEVLTMNRAAQAYYYHQNAIGSVAAVTDGTATPVERYSYDAYGLVTVTNGTFTAVPPNSWGTPHSGIGNPWMFTGRQLDEEAGLYFYRARYYDALKGRFLQRDSLGYADGMNLYEYGRDNPVAFADPSGLEAECDLFAPRRRRNPTVVFPNQPPAWFFSKLSFWIPMVPTQWNLGLWNPVFQFPGIAPAWLQARQSFMLPMFPTRIPQDFAPGLQHVPAVYYPNVGSIRFGPSEPGHPGVFSPWNNDVFGSFPVSQHVPILTLPAGSTTIMSGISAPGHPGTFAPWNNDIVGGFPVTPWGK